MAIGRVIEVTGESTESFEDAIQLAVGRAAVTLRQLKSAWIKEQRISIVDGAIATYQVNLLVTFELEE
jgi:flavin-binding protein dodecin